MITGISARARELHRRHPICDLLGLNLSHPRFLVDDVDLGVYREDTCRGDLLKFEEWGLTLVVCKGGPAHYSGDYAALWRAQPEWRPGRETEPLCLTLAFQNPTQLLLVVLDRFLTQVEANAERARLVRCYADIERARAEGRVALLMGANRSDWFGDCPGVLRMVARLGLRMITLAQGTRELGYDAYNETRSGGRMTDLGVRMLQEMNSLGILIDISHLNDPSALDAIAVSERPVVASHSNPRARQPSPRRSPQQLPQPRRSTLRPRPSVCDRRRTC